MIQPLRAIHRRAFIALAFVLPTILFVGLGSRRPRPAHNTDAAQVPTSGYLVRESSGLWQKNAIQSKFYSKSDRPQDIYVVLQPSRDLNEPDLLLYRTFNAPQGNLLPAHAQLMGSFVAGKSFTVPLSVERSGHLVLFSLPHQTVFDTASLERLP